MLWLTVPPDDQTLRIAGLSAPVDITFDGNGVPRIRAANERDAAAAIGFVHARDRMFQMELMRRAASGRLSELAGPATLALRQADARVRSGAASPRPTSRRKRPETRALLEAYAAGVNAWIARRGRFAAMEFLLFGAPDPWRPADSLMWGRSMGLLLSSNYRTELTRQSLRDKLSPARAGATVAAASAAAAAGGELTVHRSPIGPGVAGPHARQRMAARDPASSAAMPRRMAGSTRHARLGNVVRPSSQRRGTATTQRHGRA